MTVGDRLSAHGCKKLLALDGGGIRGALTIEVLACLEQKLRAARSQPDLVLGDYFDYIGGTSTGAILAAALARGMSTATLRAFYEDSGPAMFDKASILKRYRYKFAQEALATKLRETFGSDTQLGDDSLRTLLLVVMRNATTDSPWPISNNPNAMVLEHGDDDDNLRLPLWQLIRASTAAPTYFPTRGDSGRREPVPVRRRRRDDVQQSGVSAVLDGHAPAYRLEWRTGEREMLLVSIGTGHAPNANADLDANDMNLLYSASSVPSALMAAALHNQDTLCRVFGKCLVGDVIDREIGDLKDTPAPGGGNLFTYLRYNAELSDRGLAELGLGDIDPARVQKLDSIDAIDELQEVGRRVAESVDIAHFRGFV